MKSRREAVAGMLLRLRAMSLPHRLMMAFESVPRQNFVPVMHLDESYDSAQLPIECGQTMPGPDQLARILSRFDLREDHRVLEIGTGTGYQTGLLATLSARVVSLERFRTLVDKAAHRLNVLGLDNADIQLADGSRGVPGQTFDRIIVNCAYEETPSFFIDQLASNGTLIAPVGPADGVQMLRKFTKAGSRLEVSDLFEVRMQPVMTGISRAI
ncbi:MAG: protein-L-isoaspartate(D-aspartate) O-methyltransferase [Pseudomonadota bacterium]|nr:protein-L-isoaspartate(D-aspartate) O-methyltransferase [Pseudomonadota bacterium]